MTPGMLTVIKLNIVLLETETVEVRLEAPMQDENSSVRTQSIREPTDESISRYPPPLHMLGANLSN